MTTRPTTGSTLAWAVACERDQWGRAIAGTLSLKHMLVSVVFFIILHLECFRTESTFCFSPGHVNVAPRHLTAEAETLLSATLIHEVCNI